MRSSKPPPRMCFGLAEKTAGAGIKLVKVWNVQRSASEFLVCERLEQHVGTFKAPRLSQIHNSHCLAYNFALTLYYLAQFLKWTVVNSLEISNRSTGNIPCYIFLPNFPQCSALPSHHFLFWRIFLHWPGQCIRILNAIDWRIGAQSAIELHSCYYLLGGGSVLSCIRQVAHRPQLLYSCCYSSLRPLRLKQCWSRA